MFALFAAPSHLLESVLFLSWFLHHDIHRHRHRHLHLHLHGRTPTAGPQTGSNPWPLPIQLTANRTAPPAGPPKEGSDCTGDRRSSQQKLSRTRTSSTSSTTHLCPASPPAVPDQHLAQPLSGVSIALSSHFIITTCTTAHHSLQRSLVSAQPSCSVEHRPSRLRLSSPTQHSKPEQGHRTASHRIAPHLPCRSQPFWRLPQLLVFAPARPVRPYRFHALRLPPPRLRLPLPLTTANRRTQSNSNIPYLAWPQTCLTLTALHTTPDSTGLDCTSDVPP